MKARGLSLVNQSGASIVVGVTTVIVITWAVGVAGSLLLFAQLLDACYDVFTHLDPPPFF